MIGVFWWFWVISFGTVLLYLVGAQYSLFLWWWWLFLCRWHYSIQIETGKFIIIIIIFWLCSLFPLLNWWSAAYYVSWRLHHLQLRNRDLQKLGNCSIGSANVGDGINGLDSHALGGNVGSIDSTYPLSSVLARVWFYRLDGAVVLAAYSLELKIRRYSSLGSSYVESCMEKKRKGIRKLTVVEVRHKIIGRKRKEWE